MTPKDWKKLLEKGEFESEEAAADEGVRETWWHTGWIPFASNGGGDYLCLDLAPGKGGTRGQVTRIQHDDPARDRLADSFGIWLQQLADTIEAGGFDDLLG